MMDKDPALIEALQRALTPVLGAAVTVRELRSLSMGASKEICSFVAATPQGATRSLVLRRDPPADPHPQRMACEAALLQAARQVDVPVPEVLAQGDGADGIGSPYLIMECLSGETIPRKILRDPQWAGVRAVLARRLGEIAARIHRIPPDTAPTLDRSDQMAFWLEEYQRYGPPSPTFELALQWLEAHRPPPRTPVLVHGDFRLGNLMLGPEDVVGVLDWELAHLGDPISDLGWACVTAWRFGAPLPVAGVGEISELIDGYRQVSGWAPTPEEIHWWIVFGIFRWGTICRRQAARHLSGRNNALELAAIGRRFAENEHDLLVEMGYVSSAGDEDIHPEASEPDGLLGLPDALTLLTALRGALDRRGDYEDKVAGRVVDNIYREISLGPSLRAQVNQRLRDAGVDDEQQLVEWIRRHPGQLNDKVRAAVCAGVQARLQIWNPRYLSS